MRNLIVGWLVVLVMAPTSIQAHHSFFAEFDPTKPITLTGPITKVEWTNPHIFLYLDVKDQSGKVTNWAIEMGNVNSLIRLGWSRTAIKIGDVVTVEGALARDGSNLANAKMVLLDGKKMFAGSSAGSAP